MTDSNRSTEAVNISRDPYGLSKLRRAFEESQHRTGMVVGLPKVTIDASHVNHALVYIDALREEIQHLRSSAGAEVKPLTVQEFVRADDATRERIGEGIARRAFARQSPEPSAKDYIARLPADWFKDSSLETWFPLTAEELKRLRMEVETLRRQSGEPAGQPPKAYRLQDRFDPTRYVEYNPGMWDLILIPQPPTKDGKL